MLNLYGQTNNYQEMEKLGNFMLKKYKDVENLWYDVGLAYFTVGKIESARFVLQRALTILNKKQRECLGRRKRAKKRKTKRKNKIEIFNFSILSYKRNKFKFQYLVILEV